MHITKIGFDINEYTIFIFVLVVLLFVLMLYYHFKIHKLEKKIKELYEDKKHKHKIKHIRKTRKN